MNLILTLKVNCQGQVIGFVVFEKVRIDTEILFVLYIQPEKRKVIIVYIGVRKGIPPPKTCSNFPRDRQLPYGD